MELGVGVGPITTVVEKRLPAHVSFLAFEPESEYRAVLSRRFPGLRLYGNIAQMDHPLDQEGLNQVYVIIYAIPLNVLSKESLETLMPNIKRALAPGDYWP